MNGYFVGLLLIPLAIPLIGKIVLHQSISKLEFLIHVLLVILSVFVCVKISTLHATYDELVLNGVITGKKRVEVSCSHSYQCNCYNSCSGTGNSRTCTRICQTCYEHRFDVDWDVYANTGAKNHSFSINREDRQGLVQPPRWTLVENGQAFSTKDSFVNYVKAAPDSIFAGLASKDQMEKYKEVLQGLPYPKTIYDYHKLNRVYVVGPNLGEFHKYRPYFNKELSELLKVKGPAYRANVVYVLTEYPREFSTALNAHWLGGKQNDTLVFIGLDKAEPNSAKHPIKWVSVKSWSENKLYQVELTDRIESLKSLAPSDVVKTFEIIGEQLSRGYVPRNMEKDFEYLKNRIQPSGWVLAILLILNSAISTALLILFHRIDLEKELFQNTR